MRAGRPERLLPWFLGLCAALVIALAPGSAARADEDLSVTREKRKAITEEIEAAEDRQKRLRAEASRLAEELVRIRRQLVTVTAEIQSGERAIEGFTARLDKLEAEAHAARTRLAERSADLTGVLSALTRLGRQPTTVMVASPKVAGDAVRTSILLSGIVPTLEAEGAALRRELDDLDRLGKEIAAETKTLDEAMAQLADKRRRLDSLLAEKNDTHRRTQQAQAAVEVNIARLAAEAQDLDALIELLEKDAAAARRERALRERSESATEAALPLPPSAPFSSNRGLLPLPVNGRIVAGFNEPDSAGGHTRGITVETQPDAPVIAPYDGQVMFAGPFRGYGELLIISMGEGYHVLLAGMARSNVSVGQWLLAGEPVGFMASMPERTKSGGPPRLYVEIRRHGVPINPLPWMAAGNRKVSG